MPDDKSSPVPAEPQRDSDSSLSQEALEQLKADYLELETEAKYVFRDPSR